MRASFDKLTLQILDTQYLLSKFYWYWKVEDNDKENSIYR